MRNETDFGYEMMLCGINKHLGMKAETLFIPTSAEYGFVCSAFVRELIKYGCALTGWCTRLGRADKERLKNLI